MEEGEDQTIIFKTDQEPAIKFFAGDVCMSATGTKTIVEQAPVASKGAIGVVERAVQTVEHVRIPNSQLDDRDGTRVDTRHPIVTWLRD